MFVSVGATYLFFPLKDSPAICRCARHFLFGAVRRASCGRRSKNSDGRDTPLAACRHIEAGTNAAEGGPCRLCVFQMQSIARRTCSAVCLVPFTMMVLPPIPRPALTQHCPWSPLLWSPWASPFSQRLVTQFCPRGAGLWPPKMWGKGEVGTSGCECARHVAIRQKTSCQHPETPVKATQGPRGCKEHSWRCFPQTFLSYQGGGGLCKLEFLQFKVCTTFLYSVCSVFLVGIGRRCKRPLFLMNNWEPYIICSLIFKKWHRFCRARICRFIFSPARNTPPPPGMGDVVDSRPGFGALIAFIIENRMWPSGRLCIASPGPGGVWGLPSGPVRS